MKPINNIKRIAMPSKEILLEEYILKQKPVIITDMYRNDPIRQIVKLEDALDLLGNLQLTIKPEYSYKDFDVLWDESLLPEKCLTFKQYIEFIKNNQNTTWMCVQQKTPEKIYSLFNEPEYTQINSEDGDTITSFLYIGNAGNKSTLHYDRDFRCVLLYQVFGRRRVICISPKESQKLRPILNFSGYLLNDFVEDDKLSFIKYTNAYDSILYPGETLFIPTAFWHHIEYLDDSMSFNVRLKRNQYISFLSCDNFHTNYLIQGIVINFLDKQIVLEKYFNEFLQIKNLYMQNFVDPCKKFNAINALFKDLYYRICFDFPQNKYFSDFGSIQESKLWESSMNKGNLYANVVHPKYKV